jgi:hypothetical protein
MAQKRGCDDVDMLVVLLVYSSDEGPSGKDNRSTVK